MKKGKVKKILAVASMGVMALGMPIVLTGCSSDDQFNVRVEGDYVQWQKEGDENWNNLLSVDAIKDMLGDAYKGDKGEQGNPGIDGREVELRAANGYIQWRYIGEDSWKNLVALGQLTPDFDSYITVHNLNTEFLVNEELDLSNAYLKYYLSEENYDIVKITEDMIAWQGTATTGEFEMMVIYNGKAETISYNVYDAFSIVEKAVKNSIEQGSVKVNVDSVEGAEMYYIFNTDCSYYYNHGEYGEEFDEKRLQQIWHYLKDDGSFNSYYLHEYDNEIISAEKSVKDKEDLELIDYFFNQYTYVFSGEFFQEESDYFDDMKCYLIRNLDKSFTAVCEMISTKNSYKEVISLDIKEGLITIANHTSCNIEETDVVRYKSSSKCTYGEFEIPALPEGIDWEIVSGNL